MAKPQYRKGTTRVGIQISDELAVKVRSFAANAGLAVNTYGAHLLSLGGGEVEKKMAQKETPAK
jgi:hypothetical protein